MRIDNYIVRQYEDGDIVSPIEKIKGDIDAKDGVAFTLTKNNEPVVSGGVRSNHEVWLSLSSDGISHTAIKSIYKVFAILWESLGYPELTAYIKEDFPEGVRIAKRFGFSPTGDIIEREGIKLYRYIKAKK